ncbi:MAG: hypothetical protein UHW86_08430 [Spirochaetota bacterium]|jgi:hypothetical protein|nr:hypothetical protein [Spirochaetota bacterium]
MNILNELLILNRIVLFVKQLIEEPIDIVVYAPLIKDNILFVSNRLDSLYTAVNSSSIQFRKQFLAIAKRQVEIIKFIQNERALSKNFQPKILNNILNTAMEYCENIANVNHNCQQVDLNNNYVNESEYGLLLNQMSEK